MMPRLLVAALAVALLSALAVALFAAPPTDSKPLPGPAPAAVPAPATKTKKVLVKFKSMVSQKAEGNARVSNLTMAEVDQDDAVFTSDVMVVHSEKNVHEFTCTGNPVFTDPESHVTADKVVAYSSPRRAQFTGNVKMINTPKPKKDPKDQGNDMKNEIRNTPSTTTCESMDYDYANKTALAKGNVVVVQKKRTLWADQAVYNQKAELITMTGNVRMENTGDDELKELNDADVVTISLENDWIEIRPKDGGLSTMVLNVKDEEKPAEKK